MKMQRILPPLVIALAISGLCTLGLSRRLQHPSAAAPQQHYVAVSHPMQAGEVIRADNVQLIGWPGTNPVAGTFAKTDLVVGRSVLFPVEPDQPLTEHMLSAAGAGAGLAGRIPEGMRAVALKSDEIMGVAGFLMPGSHLDMLVTYRSDRVPDPITVTVLQNVQMIAAGHEMQPDPTGKPAPVDVVTLLLTPADADRAVLASTQGAIHFVLRSGSDSGRMEDHGVALSQLSGVSLAPASAGALPSATSGPAMVRPGRFGPITPPPVPGYGPSPAPAPAAASAQAQVPGRILSTGLPAHSAHQQTVETIAGDKQVTATFDEAPR